MTDHLARLRRIEIRAFGAPDVIQLVESESIPQPDVGEVRIKTEASSLVFTDMLIRRNLYPVMKLKLPLVLGYDVIGHIDAVGPGVTGWKVGDRVADLTQIGGNATHVVRPAESLVGVPNDLNAIQAEPLVLSYLTAYQALFRESELSTGDPVLICGASGAVGLAALDLCRTFGLHATGIASARREPIVKDYGATFVAYDEPGMSTEVNRLSQEINGFKAIIDTARGEPLSSVMSRLAPDGRLVVTGFSGPFRSAHRAGKSQPGLLARIRFGSDFLRVKRMSTRSGPAKRTVFYDIAENRAQHPDWFRADLSTLFTLLQEDRIRPRVQRVFGLDEVIEAHRLIDSGQVEGRLVLDTTKVPSPLS